MTENKALTKEVLEEPKIASFLYKNLDFTQIKAELPRNSGYLIV